MARAALLAWDTTYISFAEDHDRLGVRLGHHEPMVQIGKVRSSGPETLDQSHTPYKYRSLIEAEGYPQESSQSEITDT